MFLFFSLFFLLQPCFSAERELLLLMDIPVVITASKTEQPITEAPATIDIVTARDIRELGLRTLADVLRIVPGIDTVDVAYTQYYSARGLGYQRLNSSVLCMIDGHPYNEVTQGSTDPKWVSLSNVKRIEIIKGPGSALYGANAFSGVINIITKDPVDAARPSAAAGFGNYQANYQEAVFGRGDGKRGFVGSVWHHATNAVIGHGVNTNDDRNDLKAYGKVLAGDYTVAFDHYQTDLGIPGFLRIATDDYRGRANQDFLTVDFSRDVSDSLRVKVLSRLLRTYIQIEDAVLGPVEAHGMQAGCEGQVNYKPSPAHSFVGGMEWKQDTNDSSSMGGYKQIATEALYLQDEWRACDDLIFTIGARYDIPSVYKKVLSPRANAVYKFSERTVLKASYGEAFRAPNFAQLYGDLWLGGVGVLRLFGNPDLVPENLKTTELGLSHRAGNGVHYGLSLFHIDDYDAIYFAKNPNNITELNYVNKKQIEINGAEATVGFRLSPSIETTFAYANQYAEDRDLRKISTMAPREKLYLRFNLLLAPGWRMNTMTTYVGTRYNEDYVYVAPYSLTSVQMIVDLAKDTELGMHIDNLFEREYQDLPKLPICGRSIMVDIRRTF